MTKTTTVSDETYKPIKGQVEQESKKEETKIEIKNRWTGSIVFSSKKETIKEAVIDAISSDVDLRDVDLSGADLRGAYLRDAYLGGADLRDADLYNAKFCGKGGIKKLTKKQLPDFLKALGFIIED